MNRTLENQILQPEQVNFTYKIGSTIYQIGVHYNDTNKESLDDKIFRMMKNDLQSGTNFGIIKAPQAELLPERGSL